MSRLNRDAAMESVSQHGKKCARNAGIEREGGRELHEQAASLGAQRRDVGEEIFQQVRASHETLVMCNRARELDGKAKCAWHVRGPTLEGRRTMATIESGVDLDGRQHLCITRQM